MVGSAAISRSTAPASWYRAPSSRASPGSRGTLGTAPEPCPVENPRPDRRIRDRRDHPARGGEVLRRSVELGTDRRVQARGGDRGVEGAVPPEDVARGLLPDAGHAGQAVGRVAAHERVVEVAVAGDAVLLRDPALVDLGELAHAAQRVEDLHPRIAHDREEVAVAGHDLDRPGLARGDRGDDVLRLEPVGLRVRQADRVEDLEDDRELQPDLVGRIVRAGDAVGLVRRQRLDPERRPPIVVERDEEPRWPAIGQQPAHEVEEPVRGVDLRPVWQLHLGDGVIRAIEEARRVQKEQRTGQRSGLSSAQAPMRPLLDGTLPARRGSFRDAASMTRPRAFAAASSR